MIDTDKLPRVNRKLPTRFVPVGKTLNRYGRVFKCVLRPDVSVLDPCEACRGCWFSRTHRDDRLTSNCNAIQCSSWDRKDGENVWFVAVADVSRCK